jgi:hypothetical protein
MSLSISDKIIPFSKRNAEQLYDPTEERDWDMSDDERNFDDVIAEASDEGNFGGLAKLLQLSSQLENLEIHQYHLDVGVLSHDEMLGERVLQRVVEMDTLPKLKRIELRGFHVREADLLAFIQRIGARRIFMYNVLMSSGTFRSVFNYCTSEMAGVEELYFDKLFERELGIFFDRPWHSQFQPLAGAIQGGSVTLKKNGVEVIQQIFYHSARDDSPGSPEVMEYRRQWWREYGPPSRGFV